MFKYLLPLSINENLKQLLDKNEYEKLIFEGKIEKKRKENIISLIHKFQERYFKIEWGGLILTYYESKPGIYDEPKGIFYIKLITDLIKLENNLELNFCYKNKKILLKLKTNNLLEKWFYSINYFISKKFDFLDLDNFLSNKFAKEKQDIELINLILKENELDNINSLKYNSKYEKFYNSALSILGINELLLSEDNEFLNKRLVICFISKLAKKKEIKTLTGYDHTKIIDKTINLSKSKNFFFIISRKPLRKLNYNKIDLDEEIFDFDKKQYKEFIDFNRIIYFKWKNRDKEKLKFKYIDIKNVWSIQFKSNQNFIKKRFYLKIETHDKILDLCFKYEFLRNLFYNGVNKAKQNYEENKRFKNMNINIEPIFEYYKKNKEELYNYLINDMKCKLKVKNIETFLNRIKEIIIKFNNRLNSIIAMRPFDIVFYKYFIRSSYNFIFESMVSYWNSNPSKFDLFNLKNFLVNVYYWFNVTYYNSLIDNRMGNFLKTLIKSFIYKQYIKVQQIMINILMSSKNKFKIIDNKYYSEFGDSLFNLFDQILEIQKLIPIEKMNLSLIVLISKLFHNIFENLISSIKNDEIKDFDVLLALLNSNLNLVVKLKKIYDYMKKTFEINEKKLGNIFQFNIKLKMIYDLKILVSDKIKENIIKKVDSFFIININSKELDVNVIFEQIIKELEPIIIKLDFNNTKMVWEISSDKITQNYLQYIINYSSKDMKLNKLNLIERVENIKNEFSNLFKDKLKEFNYFYNLKKFDQILIFLKEFNFDLIIISLTNICFYLNNNNDILIIVI